MKSCSHCKNFVPVNGDKVKKVSQSIPDELGIWGYPDYESIPAAKRAWVTIKAKQQGKSPNMVHAGIKARFNRGK